MKQRVEIIGNCTLYLGDCLAVLPTLGKVDAVVTDPPYSSGGFTRGDRTLETSRKYQQTGLEKYFDNFSGDSRDQRSWVYWMSFWISLALRVLEPGAMFCLFTDWRQLPATTDALQCGGGVWRGIAVWDKQNGRPFPDRFKSSAEYIVWGRNGPRKIDMKDKDSVYLPGVFSFPFPSPLKREHSTQKPIELMKNLVQVARPGKTILDPFMGSGTTGVACVEQGRCFVGIELNEKYFAVACKRIEEAWRAQEKQPGLFPDTAGRAAAVGE
ncbi:MAG: site-specific DNA-methyltransferase [Treponema sp.]|jgi:site-specific DNA-methyltransferase (adenine-specific)|nr:site-specific DNA-methyltransferase [Treponema sp.]